MNHGDSCDGWTSVPGTRPKAHVSQILHTRAWIIAKAIKRGFAFACSPFPRPDLRGKLIKVKTKGYIRRASQSGPNSSSGTQAFEIGGKLIEEGLLQLKLKFLDFVNFASRHNHQLSYLMGWPHHGLFFCL